MDHNVSTRKPHWLCVADRCRSWVSGRIPLGYVVGRAVYDAKRYSGRALTPPPEDGIAHLYLGLTPARQGERQRGRGEIERGLRTARIAAVSREIPSVVEYENQCNELKDIEYVYCEALIVKRLSSVPTVPQKGQLVLSFTVGCRFLSEILCAAAWNGLCCNRIGGGT